MPISKDLLLAVLSIDSYNCGYDAGIADPSQIIGNGGLGTSRQLGTVSLLVGSRVLLNAANDADLAGHIANCFSMRT